MARAQVVSPVKTRPTGQTAVFLERETNAMTPALAFEKFGKYDIVRKLGRSMTDVYLAFDREASRNAVLKIVEQSGSAYTELVIEAERRGAAIQDQLHSLDRRILEVYEAGEQQGCFFVAMQYAEGKSLAEILQRDGKLEPRRAARYAAEVCSQLGTLHAFQAEVDGHKRAVVHGDIKPSNIQIGPDGEVWLLDFGIAKAITATRNLTHHNLGSPAYCSPERLKLAQVDPHADLWALGVCLYELVAALPPYQAQTTRKLENLIQSRRPPRSLPDSCPSPLRAIIWRALAADVSRRYPSAKEFESDLRAFLANSPTNAERALAASWDANTTVEKAKQRQKTTRNLRANRGFLVTKLLSELSVMRGTLLAGFLFGLLCFVPTLQFYRFWNDSEPLRLHRSYVRRSLNDIASDWRLYQVLIQQNSLFGRFSPALQLGPPLRTALLATASSVADSYRRSSDPNPKDFDWEKARVCLSHAVEIDPSDALSRSRLALAEGYLQFLKGSAEATGDAEKSFRRALALVPDSPDAHLGLARWMIYAQHNIGSALGEFHAAEQANFNPGPREFEQQADGYLFRAGQELTEERNAKLDHVKQRSLAFARRDLERAKTLYEPIAGFSKVNESLVEVERDEASAAQMEAALTAPKPRRNHTRSKVRKWR